MSSLGSWLACLVEPSDAVVTLLDRRRVRLLALLCLVLTPLAGIAALARTVFGPSGYRGIWVIVASLPLVGLAYALARTQRFRWGVRLFVVLACALPFLIYAFSEAHTDINVLRYLVVTLLVGSVLLSFKSSILLAVGNVVGMLLIPLVFDATWAEMMRGVFGFVLIGMGLTLVATYHRQQIERDRQRDLVHSERFLRSILNASPVIICARDSSGRYALANRALADLYGVPTDRIEGSTDYELALSIGLEPEPAARLAQRIQEAIYGPRTEDGPRPISMVGRPARWFSIHSSPLASMDQPDLALYVAHEVTDQHHAQEALRESEERFRLVFDQATAAISFYDVEGRVVRLNQQAAANMGGAPGDFVGISLTDMFGKERSAEFYRRIRQSIETGKVARYEDWLRAPNGERCYSAIYTPIRHDDQIVGVQVMADDITERRRAHDALQRSERHLRGLYDALGAGVVLQDGQGRIVEANRMAAEILGYAAEELLGHSSLDDAWQMVDETGMPVSGDQHPAMIAMVTGKPQRDVVRGIYADDPQRARWLLVNAEPIRGEQLDSFQVLTTFIDITELRRARDAERESDSRYRAILQSSPDGIAVTDLQGNILQCNHALCEILGHDITDTLLGQNVLAMVPEQDRSQLETEMSSVLHNGLLRDTTYRAVRQDGSLVPVEVSTSLMYGVDGEPIAHVSVIKDVSQRLSVEEERRSSLQMFNDVVEAVPTALFICQYEPPDRLVLLQANPLTKQLTAIGPEHVGQTIDKACPNLFETGFVQLALQVAKTGKTVSVPDFEYGDGHTKGVFRVRVFSMVNERIGVAFDDVTGQVRAARERERALAELEEANYQLESAQRMAELGSWRRDLLTDNAIWSDELLRLWGRTVEQGAPSTQGMLALVHPDDRARLAGFLDAAKSEAKPYETQFRFYRQDDGALRYSRTEAEVVLDEDGRPRWLIGISHDITDQVHAEAALRESEKRYRLLAEHASDVIWTTDKAGLFTYVSPSSVGLTGFTPEETLRQSIRETLTASSYAQIETELELIAHATCVQDLPAEAMRFALEQPCKDGSTVWIEAVVTVLADDHQRVTGLLGVSRNISERLAAERALQASEEKYRLLVENQTDLLVKATIDGCLEFVSPSYCDLFGKTEDELLGQAFMPLVHPDDRAATETALQDLNHPPHTCYVEQRALTRYGWRWLAWVDTAVLGGDGQMVSIIAAGRDITERVEAEQALADSEQILRQVVDRNPTMIYAKDTEGRFQFANQAIASELGLAPSELIGLTEADLDVILGRAKGLGATFVAEDRRVIESQRPMVIPERRFAGRADRNVWIETVKVPLTLSNDRRWVLVMASDVTDRRRLEEQLRQAAKMEAVGRLAGGVAHDFNNLLTVINGYAAMLLADLPSGAAMREELGQINRAGERAAALTGQLLAFSRRQTQNERVFVLNEVLLGVRTMLPRLIGEDIVLSWHLADGLGYVQADSSQIEQVVVNLAVNARDAMPTGGTLTIDTFNATVSAEDAEQNADLDEGEYVVLAVTDTGIGMSDEVQKHVFEPFFTTKEVGKGTGLGLAVVYGAVTQNRGSIHVYSELGLGTSFKVYLPRVRAPQQTAPATEHAVAVQSEWMGNETVMVVEDEEPVRRLAAQVLLRKGYRVLVAESAAAAEAIWKEEQKNIDLLLTDVIMPGVRGPEMVKGLQRDRPDLIVIYMSGYSQEVLGHHQMIESRAKLLTKPFSPNDMARVVRQALDAQD